MSAEEEYEEGEEEIGGVGTTLGVGGTPKSKQIKVKVKKLILFVITQISKYLPLIRLLYTFYICIEFIDIK